MTSRRAAKRKDQPRFPLGDFWEDLRSKWEGDLGPHGHDTNVEVRIDVLRIMSTLLPRKPLPNDLIFAESEIRKLLEPLSLENDEKLVSRLYHIAARHLLPKQQQYLEVDLENVRQQLERVAIAARELDRVLDETPGWGLSIAARAHEIIAEHFNRVQYLSPSKLHVAVGELASAAEWVCPQLRRERGRPAHILRHQTMLDLVGAIETASGQTVQTRWGKTGLCKDTFKGALGACVLAFMRRLEPAASEESLVKLHRRVRKAQVASNGPSENKSRAR
jgi:hypothetical protein